MNQSHRDDPRVTVDGLVRITGLSNAGVRWKLTKMKAVGSLRRIGGKGGYWDVLIDP